MDYKGQYVILMACSSCNIKKCKHCYISYKGDRTADDLKAISENLTKKHRVYINGAEVLINKEYFNSYETVKQNWFLTNGLEIYRHPNIIQYLKSKGIEIVEMSYHFGIQDKISIMNNMMLEEIIKILKNNEMEIKILVTITSENYKMLNEMCSKAISLGVDRIVFTNFINQGNAINMSNHNILTEEQKNIFFEQLRQVRHTIPKEVLKIERSGNFGRDKLNDNCHFKCIAGSQSIVITPDNNIYPCIFLSKPGYEIGKLINGEIVLYYNIQNDGNLCIADEVCNKGNRSAFIKMLKKNN